MARTFISPGQHAGQHVWGGTEGSATRIGVEVASFTILAIVALSLFNPSLGPLLTAVSVAVLAGLDALVIMALLGLFPRIRNWRRDRKSKTTLNKHPTLIPEMVRLVQRTHYALYENATGNLRNISETFPSPDKSLANEVERYGQAFQGLVEMSQTQGRWDRGRFTTLVRSVVAHYAIADSVLDRLQNLVAPAAVSVKSVAVWENFKETYNKLRTDWQRLSDEMNALLGSGVHVPGSPAHSLHPASVARDEPAE